VLDQETIPRLRCKGIAGAANNQLGTPEDADRLRQASILYAPDFVASIGGALAITGIEALGWSVAEAQSRVVSSVKENLAQIFDRAERDGISTDEAARQLAKTRLQGPPAPRETWMRR
jgi:leucine dehydrogenase